MRLTPCAVRTIAVLAALNLSACLAGKRISDIDAPPSPRPAASGPYWALPDGVDVPSDRRGAAEIDGLYPSIDPRERCCWIGRKAVVAVMKPAGVSTALLTVYVPDYPFFEARAQGLTVEIAGRSDHRGGLVPGVHRLQFAVPDSLRASAAKLQVSLRADRTFVPADQGIDADRRALGLVVLGVAFQ